MNLNISNVGKLLSEPEDCSGKIFQRSVCEYSNLSERFILKNRNFTRQYAHLYAQRLATVRPALLKSSKKRWGNGIIVKKLFELELNEKCCIIGTLFKHMQLKPSILQEISDEYNLLPQPLRDRYADDSDQLILEDELQRIVLTGELDVHDVSSGVVASLYGEEEESGKFIVDDYCFAEIPRQIERPLTEEEKYIAIISGLGISSSIDNLMNIQLCLDMLTGQAGDECQQEMTSNIVRVIIAGNSLSSSSLDKDLTNKAGFLTRKKTPTSLEGIKTLDEILVQLASSVDVDLMPGEFDPANYILPQQPLHRCMFPLAMKYPTMHTVTNPYEAEINGVRILGTSGQNVTDIYKFTKLDDPLDILEKTLIWGHISPTSPDTLGCYPFHDKDPFILNNCPHIYFAGNQPNFASTIHQGERGQRVLLVTVPKFSTSASCVLISLRNFTCQILQFQAIFPDVDPESSPENKVFFKFKF